MSSVSSSNLLSNSIWVLSLFCSTFSDTNLSTSFTTSLFAFVYFFFDLNSSDTILLAFICWLCTVVTPVSRYSTSPLICFIVVSSAPNSNSICAMSASRFSLFSRYSFSSATVNCAKSPSSTILATAFWVPSSTSAYKSITTFFTPFRISAVCFSTFCLACLNTMYISATSVVVVSCVTILHKYWLIPVSTKSFSSGTLFIWFASHFALCLALNFSLHISACLITGSSIESS